MAPRAQIKMTVKNDDNQIGKHIQKFVLASEGEKNGRMGNLTLAQHSCTKLAQIINVRVT